MADGAAGRDCLILTERFVDGDLKNDSPEATSAFCDPGGVNSGAAVQQEEDRIRIKLATEAMLLHCR